MLRYIALAVLIFSLGCTALQPNRGLTISLQPDPQLIFEQGVTKIHVDVDNADTKRVHNVRAEIFNTGLMRHANAELCRESGNFGTLLPGEFRTFSCDLVAPEINQDKITAQVDAKATFTATFSAVQIVELMTEQEFNNRLASVGVARKPQSYTYRDRNIELLAEFTEPLPVVVKEGRQFFVTFTVRNIGSGFASAIRPQDVTILQGRDDLGDVLKSVDSTGEYRKCRLEQMLLPIGKDFPSFTCQLVMPQNIKVLQNYDVTININYNYEIRGSTAVDIIR